jgi:hypothetical protein
MQRPGPAATGSAPRAAAPPPPQASANLDRVFLVFAAYTGGARELNHQAQAAPAGPVPCGVVPCPDTWGPQAQAAASKAGRSGCSKAPASQTLSPALSGAPPRPTAVSCAIVSLAKRAAKRLAAAVAVPPPSLLLRWLRRPRLWPRRGRGSGAGSAESARPAWPRPLAGPVAVVVDHLLPTQFFGPYLCAYVTAKVLVHVTIARVRHGQGEGL